MSTRSFAKIFKCRPTVEGAGVHLKLEARIPGANQAMFEKLTGLAKAVCPVSKLLNAEITLEATLVS